MLLEMETIDRSEVIKKFNRYKSSEQIKFITFHQNYAYEDFIQGLRPMLGSDGQSLAFELKDGVFKKIADIALNNFRSSQNNHQSEIEKPPFEKVFRSYFKNLYEGEQATIEIPMKRVSFKIIEISDKSIFFEKSTGNKAHTLCINTLSEYYDQERVTMESGLRSYYEPLLKELLNHAKKMPKADIQETSKNYVIIIDEINRANISRVFGELITLIESDKRFGQTNELKATLPSGESFVVPPNLYIVGTMNTADKSIALLDIALRRRFEFVKIYPDASLVQKSLLNFFQNINQSIIEHKGPDFQLGHAYFMDMNIEPFDLKSVMNKKIIPLLYEYFMNSGDTVNQILLNAGAKTVLNQGLYEFDSLQADHVE
jgi:5-methylcytosine-specific restriction endonuclease McrBC GTP-binding regulatory subunit McrB